jgi:hypothetical protein
MMLPSGNDAAEALALYFGAFMLNQGKMNPNAYFLEINLGLRATTENYARKKIKKGCIS